MKTKSILIVVLLLIAVSASAQLTGFNGTWKINKEKCTVPSDQLYLSQIVIAIKGDSIHTTRTDTDPNYQEYPFDENLTFDGKEAKITIYDMPRVSKAMKAQDGTIVIESKTTFYGNGGEDNLVAKETWKSDGKILTLDHVNLMGGTGIQGGICL